MQRARHLDHRWTKESEAHRIHPRLASCSGICNHAGAAEQAARGLVRARIHGGRQDALCCML